jgi:hypothetical protein
LSPTAHLSTSRCSSLRTSDISSRWSCTHARRHAHAHARTHTHTHTHTHETSRFRIAPTTCMHVSLCVRVCACVCVCVCVCMHAQTHRQRHILGYRVPFQASRRQQAHQRELTRQRAWWRRGWAVLCWYAAAELHAARAPGSCRLVVRFPSYSHPHPHPHPHPPTRPPAHPPTHATS